MGWHRRAIKRQAGLGRMAFRARALVAALLVAVSAPLAAQSFASDGDKFLTAVKTSDGAVASDLLTAPGSTVVNYRDLDGNAALHFVIRARNLTWLNFLLTKGADPNIGDGNGDTPLILAARAGYSEGVARLLTKRALVDKTNKRGETALIAAVQARRPTVVRALLEAGASADKQDHVAGYSARDYAKRDTRSPEILRLIETTKAKKAPAMGPTRS